MAIQRPSDVAGVDSERLRDAIVEACGDACQVIVEYDADRFEVLYAADETVGLYEDEAHMEEHFARIHEYVHLDFTEAELFTEELLPVADEVEYIATGMDHMTLLRLYVTGRRTGLFVALTPEAPVDPVVEAVRDVLEG